MKMKQEQKRNRNFERPPIIIGGCPRSGTSILLSILSAHPNIFAIEDEAWAFYEFKGDMKRFREFVDRRLWPRIPLGAESEYMRWAEKTPKNVLAFQSILDFFGTEARLIHIVRDGRDVILSRHPHDTSRYWVEGWKWKYYVTKGMRYRNHKSILTVFYENLIQNFEQEILKICEFLGEECNEEIINWKINTKVKNHSAWFSEVKPLSGNSIGKWKNRTDDPVVEAFMKDREVRKLLDELGYE